MPEVLVQFDEPQQAADGRLFVAQVKGSRMESGLWEAWIEFHPHDGGDPVRTGAETEQLTRGDLRYWAGRLTRDDLSEALNRSLPPNEYVPAARSRADGAFGTDRPTEQTAMDSMVIRYALPALDPIAVLGERGEYDLRQELRALTARELQEIISSYTIPEFDVHDITRTFEDALAERIVAGAQQRVGVSADRPIAESQRADE
jgi:hypothetical protein